MVNMLYKNRIQAYIWRTEPFLILYTQTARIFAWHWFFYQVPAILKQPGNCVQERCRVTIKEMAQFTTKILTFCLITGKHDCNHTALREAQGKYSAGSVACRAVCVRLRPSAANSSFAFLAVFFTPQRAQETLRNVKKTSHLKF